jgi:COMPASS component SWD1
MSNAPLLVDLNSSVSHTLSVSASRGVDAAQNARVKSSNGNPQFSPSVACFNKRGDIIFVGNSKGEVLLIDTESKQVRALVHIPGGALIRSFSLSRSGQYLLIISNDRIIRLYEILLPVNNAAQALLGMMEEGEAEAEMSHEILKNRGAKCLQYSKEFQDRVNRVHWRAACFSGDSEYVVGASAVKGEHKIHIWNSKTGQLARILEGPKEGVTDLAWHPCRPIVASISMTAGVVYIWAKDYTENWSAFAPDFKELEENEEYVEREDEFDLMPEAEKVVH